MHRRRYEIKVKRCIKQLANLITSQRERYTLYAIGGDNINYNFVTAENIAFSCTNKNVSRKTNCIIFFQFNAVGNKVWISDLVFR